MKKSLFTLMIMLFAVSFAHASEPNKSKGQGTVKLTLTTDENGDIASVVSSDVQYDPNAWHLRNIREMTSIRNAPNGKVCMRLKANTQYDIYSEGASKKGWIRIKSCYNINEDCWVRLHDSSTGTYWIAMEVIY